jgi:alkylation response protein AidB-like acyl-CoA dehydrogenase
MHQKAFDKGDWDSAEFETFFGRRIAPNLARWHRENAVPREIFREMGTAGWLGASWRDGAMVPFSGTRETKILERIARQSPGVAVGVLIVSDLGLCSLRMFGSETLLARYGADVCAGKRLICVGNSENRAGSDAAGIGMTAKRTDGGWILNGAKAWVTNGLISDLAVVTAVTAPGAERNRRISMFLVDLGADGVRRRRLNKGVWIPSDLTRLEFTDVHVPDDHLLGTPGRGLSQVLSVFTHSRVPISGIALGTAEGAFERAMSHAAKREVFGATIARQQAKSFEAADLYARIEAARQVLAQACAAMDGGGDFRLAASMAKYLCVDVSRNVGQWAADLFGAASVMTEHPIHRYPLDAWAVSLAEGTQDVQKLVIFRELEKHAAAGTLFSG